MGRPKREDILIESPKLRKFLSNFSMNVEIVRKSKGITQQGLSNKANLSISTVSEIEQRRLKNLTLSTLVAIAEALNEDPISLITRKISVRK